MIHLPVVNCNLSDGSNETLVQRIRKIAAECAAPKNGARRLVGVICNPDWVKENGDEDVMVVLLGSGLPIGVNSRFGDETGLTRFVYSTYIAPGLLGLITDVSASKADA